MTCLSTKNTISHAGSIPSISGTTENIATCVLASSACVTSEAASALFSLLVVGVARDSIRAQGLKINARINRKK